MATVRHAWGLTVVLLTLGVIAAAGVVPFLYSELIPQFREGHFVLQMAMASPGTSTDDVVAVGERVMTALLKLPFVETVAHQIGRAEAGEDTWSVDKSEFHIELKPVHSESEEEAQSIIRNTLKDFPEVRSETLTFLGDRISESLSGETAQVVISAVGTDLYSLESAAADIQKAASDIPGVTDLRMPRSATVPTLSVKLDPVALANYGLSARDALDTIQTAFAGTTVGQTYDGARTVDVVVILAPDDRNRIDALDKLMIGNATTRTLLKNVATITLTEGRSNIQHAGAQRRVAVTFNGAKGYSLRDIVGEARERVAALKLPKDVYVLFAGQAEAEREGQIRLAGLNCIEHLAHHRRADDGVSPPRARNIGADQPAILPHRRHRGHRRQRYRNDARQPRRIDHRFWNRRAQFGDDARARRARRRRRRQGVECRDHPPCSGRTLGSVFMTALMAALGLVPLALGLGRPGHEIEAPMAITILGGLTTATLLNLGILPEALIRLGRLLGISDASPPQAKPSDIQPTEKPAAAE